MVVCALLQYEPGGEFGSDPGHSAPAVLRLEDYPDHVGGRLCQLLIRLSGVCKERAKGRGFAQYPSSDQEGSQGRWVSKMNWRNVF